MLSTSPCERQRLDRSRCVVFGAFSAVTLSDRISARDGVGVVEQCLRPKVIAVVVFERDAGLARGRGLRGYGFTVVGSFRTVPARSVPSSSIRRRFTGWELTMCVVGRWGPLRRFASKRPVTPDRGASAKL